MNKLHPSIIDITGKIFGRLIVLNITDKRTKNRDTYWLCQCECGNKKEIIGQCLKNGNTKSCGCLWLEKISKEPGVSVKNKVYCSYHKGAKDRRLAFEISKEFFSKITSLNCYYCGKEPQLKTVSGIRKSYPMNGVDRLNNSLGYLKDNCVPCCKFCNQMKWTMTESVFLNHIRKIYLHNE